MKKKMFKLSGVLIAVLLLLIFLHGLGVFGPLENILTKIFNIPIQFIYEAGSGADNFYHNIKIGCTDKEYKKENKKLKKKTNILLAENARLKILAQENESLKNELKFLKEKKYQTTSARIVSKNNYLSDVIIIDRGSRDGIRIGLPVMADEGILVGKVIATKENISTVALLTNIKSRIAASIILPDKNAGGVVHGEYGLSIKMELIPKNTPISRNDLIVTSGLEKDIPAGLIIGSVENITDISGELFKTAIVKPQLSYDDLKFVLVLTPK